MTKSKFILTEDLVKVEPEIKTEISPSALSPIKRSNVKAIDYVKERVSLNIDSSIKMELQIFCIKHKISMSEFIEKAIKAELELQKGRE